MRDGDPQDLAAAASAFSRTAAEIQNQLDHIRSLMLSLEARRLGLSSGRFQALMTGYDIYVRMLNDALTDIAADLRVWSDATEPLQVPGPSGPRAPEESR